MDNKRKEAYINFIHQLLNSPSGEEAKILEANQELVDEGLLEIMELCAQQQLAENDDEKAQNAANFLRSLRSQLVELLEIAEFSRLNFLVEVLRATIQSKSKGDSNVVYQLLQQNLDKLDDNFADILRNWATARFSEVEAGEAEYIAVAIINFSNRIQKFPLGSKANNMEISIAGYEVALEVFTHKSRREIWARTQSNLGYAYWDRIRGDKAQNIEDAIYAYQQALQVYTDTDFPSEWAMTQNNLGSA
ncbi:MAG: tetratricopeptide repeat protein, partial [Trichodesmium sp. St16_bin4-tuft]|nr:tetratricopeptide repeat protein [Trichodesmium sp. St16_bin4-tuft]